MFFWFCSVVGELSCRFFQKSQDMYQTLLFATFQTNYVIRKRRKNRKMPKTDGFVLTLTYIFFFGYDSHTMVHWAEFSVPRTFSVNLIWCHCFILCLTQFVLYAKQVPSSFMLHVRRRCWAPPEGQLHISKARQELASVLSLHSLLQSLSGV